MYNSIGVLTALVIMAVFCVPLLVATWRSYWAYVFDKEADYSNLPCPIRLPRVLTGAGPTGQFMFGVCLAFLAVLFWPVVWVTVLLMFSAKLMRFLNRSRLAILAIGKYTHSHPDTVEHTPVDIDVPKF